MKENELQNAADIDDLTVSTDQQAEIKGGPTTETKRTIVLRSSVTGLDSDLADLEPVAEVKGGVTKSGSVYTVTFGGQTTPAGPEANGHVKVFSGTKNG